MGGPSTLSQLRREFFGLSEVPGRGICLVAATALDVLTVSIGWRLFVAELGCPPLLHMQICVSELLQVGKWTLQSCGDSTGRVWALLGANSSKRDGKVHRNRDLTGLKECLDLFLSLCVL